LHRPGFGTDRKNLINRIDPGSRRLWQARPAPRSVRGPRRRRWALRRHERVPSAGMPRLARRWPFALRIHQGWLDADSPKTPAVVLGMIDGAAVAIPL